jgi:hypothetical protein
MFKRTDAQANLPRYVLSKLYYLPEVRISGRQKSGARANHATFSKWSVDSTPGSDGKGGKLLSFGYVSMKLMCKKTSKYHHSYHPLVLAES